MPPKKDAKAPSKTGEPTMEEKAALMEATLEAEKERLQMELAFSQDKARQFREESLALTAEVKELKMRLEKVTNDSSDILAHKQRELIDKNDRILFLEGRTKSLEQVVASQDERLEKASALAADQFAKLKEASLYANEKDVVDTALRKQDALIQQQEEQLDRLTKGLADTEERLRATQDECDELRFKSAGNAQLKIFFGEPWMVTRTLHRLSGEVPVDREDCTLNHMGSKIMVYYGGTFKGDHEGGLAVVNTETMTWEAVVSSGKQVPGRSSHTATVVNKSKLVVYGGHRKGIVFNDVNVLYTDTMKWHSQATKGPSPTREGHAAAMVGSKIYVCGGYDAEGLHADVSVLDFDTMLWTQALGLFGGPSPRRGHSMMASEDGRRLFVFGGFDGKNVLNDLHILETDRMQWSTAGVEVSGKVPPAREGHASGVVGKYMLISSGQDTHRRLADTYALNTETLQWDCLDRGTEHLGSALHLKQRGCYCALNGNRLYLLRPNREDEFREMEVVEFNLPEEIEQLRLAAQERKQAQADRLELADAAVINTTSIDLSWHPPTKNADRIDNYKLMMATPTGVVKEVAYGKFDTFRVTHLRPNTQYIFCVKAIYDDGSFLWSESKSYITKFALAATGNAYEI